MPPIINSEHTRLTVNTKNVFIDVTGLDLTKSHIVLNTLVAMFSEYCEKPFTVEAVEISQSNPCDIAEDLAISFGYNNICKQPAKTLCSGSQQPLNKLTDLIRLEFAQAEYIECLTMALISKKDNFAHMNKEETDCVHILDSKVAEFEIFRTSLLPCLFKTIEANKAAQVIIFLP